MDGLKRVDALPTDEARDALFRCCGSTRWAEAMAGRRPFEGEDALFAASVEELAALGRDDWLEAFSHHPRIGDRKALGARFRSTRQWSSKEQGAVAEAGEDVLTRLAEANQEYLDRFGYTFIVCATGKSAAEMLTLLQERLDNDPEQEIGIAAVEQAKITAIRLKKLLEEAQ